MRIGSWISILCLSASSVAFAGSLEDGSAAFERHDYATALRLLRPLADQGNAVAQYQIGVQYEHGWGVEQDYVEAIKWLRKSADQGCGEAKYQIGYLYSEGQGVQQDQSEADKWYKASHERSNGIECKYVVPPPHNFRPPKGVIPDAATAIQVGEAILKPIYGEEKIKREEPFTAMLEGDIWAVGGHFYGGKGTLGGVAVIELSKSKGCVLRISHDE